LGPAGFEPATLLLPNELPRGRRDRIGLKARWLVCQKCVKKTPIYG